MTHFSTILFDWDGTLADTSRLRVDFIKHLLSRFGYPIPRTAHIKGLLESDYREHYKKLGLTVIQREEIPSLWKAFQEGREDYSLADGAAETLSRLKQLDGLKLGIVSNENRFELLKNISRLGLEGTFDCIIAFEDAHEFKPSPLGIRLALRELNSEASSAIYVGDMVGDIRTGKNAGVATACISKGLHPRWMLLKENPDYMLKNICSVMDLVTGGSCGRIRGKKQNERNTTTD